MDANPESTRSNGALALVTGGHGFLGSHLVELLLARGLRVRCLVRPGRDAPFLSSRPVEVARGDLRSAEGLARAAAGADYVFHVAGLVAARHAREFEDVNAAGTARLAAAVASTAPGCRRFVYVSSQAAAGPSPDGTPLTEECRPRPLTTYGRSKLAGERLLPGHAGPVPWTIVRPPALYGPRDEGVLPFFQLAGLGLAAGLEGRGRRFNLLHGEDAAEGVLSAALAPGAAGRTYFLADERGYGYDDVARCLAGAFGRRLRRIPVPDFAVDLAALLTDEAASLLGRVPVFGREKARELKARWWLCSAALAVRELGWTPRIPLAEGFAATARWYAAAGRVRPPSGVPGPL